LIVPRYQNRKTLRRFDYIIYADDVTAIAGLNNNINPLPDLCYWWPVVGLARTARFSA